MPLAYEPYDWSDVREPTDQELAEIEAAVDAAPAPPASVRAAAAWTRSGPVRVALEQVGMPDGSHDWIVAFASHLLAYTDARGAALTEVAGEHLVEQVAEWRNAYQNMASTAGLAGGSTGGAMFGKSHEGTRRAGLPKWRGMPTDIPRALFKHADFAHVAWLLCTPPEHLMEALWTTTKPGHLTAGLARVKAGETVEQAAIAVGCSARALREYAVACRVERTTADNRKFGREQQQRRALELWPQHKNVSAVHRQLVAEGVDVAEMTVRRWLDRAGCTPKHGRRGRPTTETVEALRAAGRIA